MSYKNFGFNNPVAFILINIKTDSQALKEQISLQKETEVTHGVMCSFAQLRWDSSLESILLGFFSPV